MERDSKRSWEKLAEKLPLEVIGDILSRVGVARDAIRASVTCKKWRKAYIKHLHALAFDFADFKFPKRQGSVPDIELWITRAILQTRGLRKLSILMGDDYKFSASSAYAWLMSVRETLSELFYEVETSTSVNALGILEWRKLESLSLANYNIGRGELSSQIFPCLTSLSLCNVGISVEDLNRFLSAPPKLESLELNDPFQEASNAELFSPEKVVKVCCPTLKAVCLENMKLFRIVLENSSIECLQLECCHFRSFEVYGSKTLRDIKVSDSKVWLLEIDETDNLESFDIITSTVTKSNLFPMMMQAPKCKRYFVRGDDDRSGIVLDLENMALCLPQLSHLAIFCDDRLNGVHYRFGGSTSLEKVVVLEIGWDGFDGFCEWAEKLLKCCPNVKKVIVHWVVDDDTPDNLKNLSVQSSLMVQMMSKYQHIKMQFAFSYYYDLDFDE